MINADFAGFDKFLRHIINVNDDSPPRTRHYTRPALYIHFVRDGASTIYDEWISIKDEYICKCDTPYRCGKRQHKLALLTLNPADNHYYRFWKDKWLFIDRDKMCDCADIELCENASHTIRLI